MRSEPCRVGLSRETVGRQLVHWLDGLGEREKPLQRSVAGGEVRCLYRGRESATEPDEAEGCPFLRPLCRSATLRDFRYTALAPFLSHAVVLSVRPDGKALYARTHRREGGCVQRPRMTAEAMTRPRPPSHPHLLLPIPSSTPPLLTSSRP